jgi:hypothetical protein
MLSVVVIAAHALSAQGPRLEGLREPGSNTTIITGVVFDSLANRGLVGATVQIADATGKAWTSTRETDGTGRFEFVRRSHRHVPARVLSPKARFTCALESGAARGRSERAAYGRAARRPIGADDRPFDLRCEIGH